MHKVDPIQIMLSDIFEKVFYNKEPSHKVCEDCDGDGKFEVEIARPHNSTRDIGFYDVKKVKCETCDGNGEVEVEPCHYCGGNCPNDHEHMCDGYSGDIDNLYSEVEDD